MKAIWLKILYDEYSYFLSNCNCLWLTSISNIQPKVIFVFFTHQRVLFWETLLTKCTTLSKQVFKTITCFGKQSKTFATTFFCMHIKGFLRNFIYKHVFKHWHVLQSKTPWYIYIQISQTWHDLFFLFFGIRDWTNICAIETNTVYLS